MIEIYAYEPQDLENMKFNKWAWPLKNHKSLLRTKKYLHYFNSYTIYDTKLDKAVAILGFHEQKPGDFYGMIVADECFGDNPKYAVKMKFLIGKVKEQFGAESVETVSENAPALNKWHEFLGFHKEKFLPQYLHGKDFILWRM